MLGVRDESGESAGFTPGGFILGLFHSTSRITLRRFI
jgi:hypothetical protein